jgi:hypothetical protein
MKTKAHAVVVLLVSAVAVAATPAQRTYPTPQAAAEALVAAAERFDTAAIIEVLGPEAEQLVGSEDPVSDENQAAEFVKQAKAKLVATPDPKNPNRATIVVGESDWPLPIPLVKGTAGWKFDTAAGKKEILLRRIGRNELDAIEICHGYVEAQEEYASEPRGHATAVQYAQRVIGTADKQDGLAWRDADGTWRGPVGEKIARAIAEGYASKGEPYHGYYFKILKGQGSHAPLGALDFVVDGMMIGGFALVASPAEYEVSGIKTFIVSHDGVVYEKDLGPETLKAFQAMSLFDPDPSWSVVKDSD